MSRRLLSLLYRTGVKLRHAAYQSKILPTTQVPAVVVSIGNIVAGGTGKTPLVHFLASQLLKDHKIAILTRGYRSKAEKLKEPTLVEPTMNAADVGDEPLWLAQKLPQVEVWVCADRIASAKKAIEHGAEIILLDDGFQHRRLHRDFDIVVVSGQSPYSNGHFLPRGHLRDLPARLLDATLIAVMGSKRLDLPVRQVFFERTTAVSLKGKKVALFCAIANPERFLTQVQETGAQITVSFIKPDHDFFSAEEIEELAKKSKADMLVCTEKDFVKLIDVKTSIPLTTVPLELSITEGQMHWDKLIDQIKSQVQHVRIPSHTS
jgi:tetraacyldisaccharide 4'-kinase